MHTIGLSKQYRRDHHALHATNVSIERGDFVGIVGSSGAGKTTFLKCLNGMIRPTSGQVFFEQIDTEVMSKRTLRRNISMIFQQSNLVPQLTAYENVLIGRLGYMSGWRSVVPLFKKSDKLKALEALDRVGLIDFSITKCKFLSGGQQQRVAIARALAQEAKVLLADEPVASLDPENALNVMTLLKTINSKDKVTILANLHQLDLARKFSNSLIGFRKGTIIFNGKTEAFGEFEYNHLFI